MTAANRATRINKLHTLLKKAYKPAIASDDRPLIEHLLYGCLLENAPYELADEALARLEQEYFDWNEVRVTTVTELAEVLSRLPDPTAAAMRLKKNLHSLFESVYTFDLEELKKQNLGKAVQKFEGLPAMTPFVLAYVTQHGLGGHAIPLDSAALRFFWLADIITESELKASRVTGLERTIAKNKGIEFSSLLHQAAVALNMDPNDATARNIVLALNPNLDQKVADHVAAVKERRTAKANAKAKAQATEDEEKQAAEAKKSGKSAGRSAAKKPGAAKSTEASTPPAPPKKKTAKPGTDAVAPAKASDSPKGPAKASGAKSANAAKPPANKKSTTKRPASSDAKKSVKDSASKKPADAKAAADGSAAKTSGKKISKRKPR